jgi:hypothetical protein
MLKCERLVRSAEVLPDLFALVLLDVVGVRTMRTLATIGFAAVHPLYNYASILLSHFCLVLFGSCHILSQV